MRELFEGVNLSAFAAGNKRILARVTYRPTWAHAGYTAGGLWLFHRPVLHYAPDVLAGAATVWVLAALIAGQTEGQPETSSEALEPSDHAPAEESAPTTPTPAEAHRLTASLAAGRSSVLLTRLAADLSTAHPLWKGSTKAVRGLLAEAGIPVREGVRTPDGNGPGVHHQDVPALRSPADTATVPGVVANVGPGQSTNANANNSGEGISREGFVTQADPANPARTIIVHTADAA